MSPKQSLRLSLKIQQRLSLMGRLRMAEWIEMPEADFARVVGEIEGDPLFKKLFFTSGDLPSAIRRQRWPGGRLTSGFYELNERVTAKGEPVDVEGRLGERAALLPKIRRMGRQAFERYFLYADEPLPLEEIARRTGTTLDDVRGIHDLLLEIGAQAEFLLPNREPEISRSYSCLARLALEGEEPSFEFYAPYWARGLYQIRYDLLEDYKRQGRLTGAERRRLRHLLRRMETINLRQNTIFRILESLVKLQAEFLRTRREERKRPISLRLLAHRLQLAPSTVSRAICGRSVRLPWGREVALHTLLPGQRRVVREILSQWLEQGVHETDSALTERLKRESGIDVSRRTVNAVRNEIGKGANP